MCEWPIASYGAARVSGEMRLKRAPKRRRRGYPARRTSSVGVGRYGLFRVVGAVEDDEGPGKARGGVIPAAIWEGVLRRLVACGLFMARIVLTSAVERAEFVAPRNEVGEVWRRLG